MGGRTPGKDVEDQLAAIDDLAARDPLEVPDLSRRQFVVEEHDRGPLALDEADQFLDLAASDEGLAAGKPSRLGQNAHDLRVSGPGQRGQLPDPRFEVDLVAGQAHRHEHGSFPCDP